MPARRGRPPHDAPSPPERSALKLPLAEAEAQLAGRIQAGRELADTQIPSLETNPAAAQIAWGSHRNWDGQIQRNQELETLKSGVRQWRDYNRTWLNRNLGGEAAEEYEQASTHGGFGGSDDPRTNLRFLREEIESEISKLQSIHDRLHFWAPQDDSAYEDSAARPVPDGAIFIVHGSDTLRAERVARTVKEATGRETIILREQASLGQTLIEKFETHAAKASYAIIILTPDDEGGRKDEGNHRPRARQNVILEMGYFYGILGRSRVSVLLFPGIEKPSDMDGIVYISFDDNGAWRTELFRELEHANVHVDMSRAF
jgi:predicted nucleotide-binding protein